MLERKGSDGKYKERIQVGSRAVFAQLIRCENLYVDWSLWDGGSESKAMAP